MSATRNLPLLHHSSFPQVFAQAIHFEVTQLFHPCLCTHVDLGGYECAGEAVIQFLPDGDEAACTKHLREVSRG
jgi:hypothetical protein